ncbi:MAG: hypothetical protein AAGC55_19015, partial [Myxococcota bacterium]
MTETSPPDVPEATARASGPSPLATRRFAMGRRVLGALGSLTWMPGVGHLLLGQPGRGWMWFAVCLATLPLGVLGVPFFLPLLVVR